MVKYSARAAKALSYLKRSYNDIDVFVEDTGNHNMWLVLLRKMIPKNIKLTSVNLLGGKNKVIDACRMDQQASGRKRLYIIDGDFDYLLGHKKPVLKNLYRIKAFCVENLLIQEDAIVNIGLVWRPTWNERECAANFDFKSWYSGLVRKLFPLFVAYAVAKKHVPTFQTVSYTVNQLYVQTPNGPDLCSKKVMIRVRKVASEIRTHVGLAAFMQERRKVTARLINLSEREAVSGKDYILPLLWTRLRHVFGFQGTFEQLKVHLANGWAPNEAWLVRRVQLISA